MGVERYLCALINLSPVFVRMCIGVAVGGVIWGRVSTVWFKRLDAALKAMAAEGKTGKIAVREQLEVCIFKW